MVVALLLHDLNEHISPVEASLSWVISKDNVDFIGSKIILQQKVSGIKTKRVGVKLLEKGIAREGSEVVKDGKKIGVLTSGGFSPNLKTSIGQAYVDAQFAKFDQKVAVVVRDREIPAIICSPTFVLAKTKAIKKTS